MHITFFVGNGFDISCGLKSSYKDFYEWYCRQEKSDKAHINAFRESIEEDIQNGKENWADFEEALGKYTRNFTKETTYEFIECYEDAHKNLMLYLEKEMKRFRDDIAEDVIKKFREGIKFFYAELSPKEREPFEKIFKSYRNESSTFEFISFNYTDVLDKFIIEASKAPLDKWINQSGHSVTLSISPKITHVHGVLNHHPIFGVNDENQIANKTLLEFPNFSKLFIKPKTVEAVGEYWHDETNASISRSSIICIYGMSMGITDTIWFSKIMEWLKSSEARQIIIYSYSDAPVDNRSNWIYLENSRKIREKIINHSNYTKQQIEDISQRIHVIINTERVLRVKLRTVEEAQ